MLDLASEVEPTCWESTPLCLSRPSFCPWQTRPHGSAGVSVSRLTGALEQDHFNLAAAILHTEKQLQELESGSSGSVTVTSEL